MVSLLQKNYGFGKLSDDFKTHSNPDLKKMHEVLIGARDKFYAHMDGNTKCTDPSKGDFLLFQIYIKITDETGSLGRGQKASPGMTEIFLRDINLEQINQLREALVVKLTKEADRLQRRLLTRKVSSGVYKINMEDPSKAFEKISNVLGDILF